MGTALAPSNTAEVHRIIQQLGGLSKRFSGFLSLLTVDQQSYHVRDST